MRHLCEWPILAENRWPHIGRKLTAWGESDKWRAGLLDYGPGQGVCYRHSTQRLIGPSCTTQNTPHTLTAGGLCARIPICQGAPPSW